MKHESAPTRQANPAWRVFWQKFRQTRRHAVVLMAWMLFASLGAYGQNSKPTADQVEAAYLYNFGKFVKWPPAYTANQGEAFSICVLGDDPFGSVLQSTVAGKYLSGIPVAVRRVPKPQDAASCRVLFIGGGERSHLKDILEALGNAPVLTVSDISGFSKRGGMIEFVMESDRVRFAINLTAAESSGLVLESDLLKVAIAVRGTGRPGGPE